MAMDKCTPESLEMYASKYIINEHSIRNRIQTKFETNNGPSTFKEYSSRVWSEFRRFLFEEIRRRVRKTIKVGEVPPNALKNAPPAISKLAHRYGLLKLAIQAEVCAVDSPVCDWAVKQLVVQLVRTADEQCRDCGVAPRALSAAHLAPAVVVLRGLGVNIRCTRAQLVDVWQRLCALKTWQLYRLMRAGDRAGAVPPAERPTGADWELLDALLLHDGDEKMRLVSTTTLECVESYRALVVLVRLLAAASDGLQQSLQSAGRAAQFIWWRVQARYVLTGRTASLVLLQRRLHQLRMLTRSAYKHADLPLHPLLQLVVSVLGSTWKERNYSWCQMVRSGRCISVGNENISKQERKGRWYKDFRILENIQSVDELNQYIKRRLFCQEKHKCAYWELCDCQKLCANNVTPNSSIDSNFRDGTDDAKHNDVGSNENNTKEIATIKALERIDPNVARVSVVVETGSDDDASGACDDGVQSEINTETLLRDNIKIGTREDTLGVWRNFSDEAKDESKRVSKTYTNEKPVKAEGSMYRNISFDTRRALSFISRENEQASESKTTPATEGANSCVESVNRQSNLNELKFGEVPTDLNKTLSVNCKRDTGENDAVDEKLLCITYVKLARIDETSAWLKHAGNNGVDLRRARLLATDEHRTEPPLRARDTRTNNKSTLDNNCISCDDVADESEHNGDTEMGIFKRRDLDLNRELKSVSAGVLRNPKNRKLLELCKPVTVRLRRMRESELPRRGRAVKKVELADIEEVRRINRNILTAQVRPISLSEEKEDELARYYNASVREGGVITERARNTSTHRTYFATSQRNERYRRGAKFKNKKVAKTGAERIREYRARIIAFENTTAARSAANIEGVAIQTASQQNLEDNHVDTCENQPSLGYDALRQQSSRDEQDAGDNQRQLVVQANVHQQALPLLSEAPSTGMQIQSSIQKDPEMRRFSQTTKTSAERSRDYREGNETAKDAHNDRLMVAPSDSDVDDVIVLGEESEEAIDVGTSTASGLRDGAHERSRASHRSPSIDDELGSKSEKKFMNLGKELELLDKDMRALFSISPDELQAVINEAVNWDDFKLLTVKTGSESDAPSLNPPNIFLDDDKEGLESDDSSQPAKKKQRRKKKKAESASILNEEVHRLDAYEEWERQKHIANKYFKIGTAVSETGNKKLNKDAVESNTNAADSTERRLAASVPSEVNVGFNHFKLTPANKDVLHRSVVLRPPVATVNKDSVTNLHSIPTDSYLTKLFNAPSKEPRADTLRYMLLSPMEMSSQIVEVKDDDEDDVVMPLAEERDENGPEVTPTIAAVCSLADTETIEDIVEDTAINNGHEDAVGSWTIENTVCSESTGQSVDPKLTISVMSKRRKIMVKVGDQDVCKTLERDPDILQVKMSKNRNSADARSSKNQTLLLKYLMQKPTPPTSALKATSDEPLADQNLATSQRNANSQGGAKNKIKKVAKTGAERIREYRARIRALKNTLAARSAANVEGVAIQTASQQNLKDTHVNMCENQPSLGYEAVRQQSDRDEQDAGYNQRQLVVQANVHQQALPLLSEAPSTGMQIQSSIQKHPKMRRYSKTSAERSQHYRERNEAAKDVHNDRVMVAPSNSDVDDVIVLGEESKETIDVGISTASGLREGAHERPRASQRSPSIDDEVGSKSEKKFMDLGEELELLDKDMQALCSISPAELQAAINEAVNSDDFKLLTVKTGSESDAPSVNFKEVLQSDDSSQPAKKQKKKTKKKKKAESTNIPTEEVHRLDAYEEWERQKHIANKYFKIGTAVSETGNKKLNKDAVESNTNAADSTERRLAASVPSEMNVGFNHFKLTPANKDVLHRSVVLRPPVATVNKDSVTNLHSIPTDSYLTKLFNAPSKEPRADTLRYMLLSPMEMSSQIVEVKDDDEDDVVMPLAEERDENGPDVTPTIAAVCSLADTETIEDIVEDTAINNGHVDADTRPSTNQTLLFKYLMQKSTAPTSALKPTSGEQLADQKTELTMEFTTPENYVATDRRKLLTVVKLDTWKPVWKINDKYIILTEQNLPCALPGYWTVNRDPPGPCQFLMWPKNLQSDKDNENNMEESCQNLLKDQDNSCCLSNNEDYPISGSELHDAQFDTERNTVNENENVDELIGKESENLNELVVNKSENVSEGENIDKLILNETRNIDKIIAHESIDGIDKSIDNIDGQIGPDLSNMQNSEAMIQRGLEDSNNFFAANNHSFDDYSSDSDSESNKLQIVEDVTDCTDRNPNVGDYSIEQMIEHQNDNYDNVNTKQGTLEGMGHNVDNTNHKFDIESNCTDYAYSKTKETNSNSTGSQPRSMIKVKSFANIDRLEVKPVTLDADGNPDIIEKDNKFYKKLLDTPIAPGSTTCIPTYALMLSAVPSVEVCDRLLREGAPLQVLEHYKGAVHPLNASRSTLRDPIRLAHHEQAFLDDLVGRLRAFNAENPQRHNQKYVCAELR